MSESMQKANNNVMENYKKSNDIVADMQGIINASQLQALRAVNIALVQRNWLLGRRIAEEELSGEGALNTVLK